MAAADKRLIAVISKKGQVVVPEALRDQLHWSAGTRLAIESRDDGVLLRRAPVFPEATIDAVFGSLPSIGKSRTIEAMDVAVSAEAKRRGRE